MKYICEVCNKQYATVAEAEKCELEHKKKADEESVKTTSGTKISDAVNAYITKYWDDSLGIAYNEVVALADKMRFIYSKFVIKYSSKDLENFQICLMKMKELEIQLLNVLAEKLLAELNVEKDSWRTEYVIGREENNS